MLKVRISRVVSIIPDSAVLPACERGEERERRGMISIPSLLQCQRHPEAVRRTCPSTSRAAWSSGLKESNTGKVLLAPQGHRGGSVQQRERAERLPGKEQPVNKAKQLAQPKGCGAWRSTNYRIQQPACTRPAIQAYRWMTRDIATFRSVGPQSGDGSGRETRSWDTLCLFRVEVCPRG